MSSSLFETFTLALQGITTGSNFRRTDFSSNIGLAVNSVLDKQTFSLNPGSTKTLLAGQMVLIVSNSPLQVTIVPDSSPTITTPGSAIISSGNVFCFSGSFLTTGITIENPNTATAPAIVKAVMVT